MIKRYIGILRHPGYNGDIADDVLGFDPNGGGIYDIPIVGDVADVVINSPLGNVVAFAFPPAAPFIYAAKSTQALASGNELGAVLNAVGAYAAYTSPTATTTAELGGMEISGINANLVEATRMAIDRGASVTGIAKTLVGMGNQEAAAKVMTDAGIDQQAATEALNAAGQEAANYVPTAADAAQSVQAMQDAGFSTAAIQEQVGNWASAGIQTSDIATELANIGIAPSVSLGGLTQAEMLAKQYSGFTPEEVVQHMAGSAIDPVMGEEILTNLGYDPFLVQDYMTKNPTSFGNTYADPSLLDKLKSANSKLQSLKGIIGSSGGGQSGYGGTGTSGLAGTNYATLMQQLDPYWDYRKNTEIPMMGAAAGTAGMLSGLYQQSYTDPLAVYNTPEMQAVNARFMNDIQRRDAAAGRMSQYGSRGVEAQNNYLTNTLPAYRTGLQQGLGTMYQAAKPQALDPRLVESARQNASFQAAGAGVGKPSGLAGTVSGIQGSWNQMTQGNNIFDQAQGAINTVSGLQDLYTGGKDAWNTISGWF